MRTLGVHLLLDLENCNEKILNDLDIIKQTLISAAQKSGARIMGETFHKFTPVGVTGIVSIAESHISIHTWPEFNYAAVDIFSCGEDFDLERCAKVISDKLKCEQVTKREINRGLH